MEQTKEQTKLTAFSPSRFVIALLRLYQIIISPVLGPRCRFHPTCSEYMLQAIKKYGPSRGVIKGFSRIRKCHPFSKEFGIDEV